MKLKHIIITLLLAMLMLGCSSNNSDSKTDDNTTTTETEDSSDGANNDVDITAPDDNTTATEDPTVVLSISTATLTLNSEIVNIDVTVIDGFNNPFPTGNVKIIYPNDVRLGRDIGSFASSTVELDNGHAYFTYTAPSRLDDNTSDLTFSFYHESRASGLKPYVMKIVPKADQTILTNYTLNSNTSDGEIYMSLESSKLISFFVNDDKNELLADSKMSSITITTLNPAIGTLEDTLGNTGNTLTISSKNSVSVNIKTNTVSGIIPLKVDTTFSDANSNSQTISKVFNVVVLSGPASAMSLSYAGTTQEADRAKFVEKWVLTVTDQYNNLVDNEPAVSMGMIAGYVQDGSSTAANAANYLYFPTGNGNLSATNDNFTAQTTVFGNVDQTNDYLVTFGDGYTYNASGKWTINTNSTTVLDLVDSFDGSNTTGLGYAVGHNYRQAVCEDAVEWVGNVYPEIENDYTIDARGSIRISVEYDYYMTGKDVMLWVNLVGVQNSSDTTVRLGEAKKITLRGSGLTGETYSFAKGFSGEIRLNITITDTVEYYKNANFGYAVELSANDTNWTITGNSMSNGITSCINGGVAYVDINITDPAGEAGEVKVVNVLTSDEF